MQQLPQLSKSTCTALGKGKNLLAFSGGVDSTALFFTLIEYKIPFSVASVNYQTREQSNNELAHIKELCSKHNIVYHTHTCTLAKSNFEASARAVRYAFFTSLCKEFGYTHLLTAHQLDDALEWFLMQLTKGAGLVELIGMQEVEQRDEFWLIRPLLSHTKKELLEFLHTNNLPYFVDESNFDEKYLRNHFRHQFSSKLLELYANGIKKSFHFLSEDKHHFTSKTFYNDGELFVFENNAHSLRFIDKAMKKNGLLMSQKQRICIDKKDGVISGRVAVGWSDELVFVAPFVKIVMSREFKELCRVAKIPPNIRGYLYKNNISPNFYTHKP